MLPTVNLSKQFPAAYESQIAFGKSCHEAAAASGLPRVLFELVKVRVSQLNGCAFCLPMHSRDAVTAGASVDQLAVLAAWWESQYFTPQEQAAFTVAERITRVSEEHTSAVPTVDVTAALNGQQIAAVSWIAIAINAWNRIAIASHYPVGQ